MYYKFVETDFNSASVRFRIIYDGKISFDVIWTNIVPSFHIRLPKLTAVVFESKFSYRVEFM